MGNKKEGLKEKWISFFKIIFDPSAVTSYAIILLLVYFYSNTTDNFVKTLLTVLFSVISGLLGGILTKRWSEINEEKVIYARAISAIRSLKLLLQQIKQKG